MRTVQGTRQRVSLVIVLLLGLIIWLGAGVFGIVTGDWWPAPVLLSGLGVLVVLAAVVLLLSHHLNPRA